MKVSCLKGVPLAALASFFLTSCTPAPDTKCNAIHQMVSNPSDLRMIEDWVSKKDKNGELNERFSIESESLIVGEYAIEIDDRDILNLLPQKSQARVIINSGHEIAGVFFGKSNYAGLVVEVPNKTQRIVAQNVLQQLTGRTSVLCAPRD